MVKDELVITKEKRESGWQLLRAAQQVNIPVLGLFWARFDENDWRLFFVIPPDESTIAIYLWLRSVLPGSEEADQSDIFLLTSADIAVIGSNWRIVGEVRDWARLRYGTNDGSVADDERLVRRIRLSDSDAYIYYLAPEK